jgi:hypothetical protein
MLRCAALCLCVQAFKEVLDSLHAFSHVHLIVATRAKAPAVKGAWGGAVVELSRLGAAAGMQLIESLLGPEHCWSSSDQQAAARKLVEVVQGNPMVLSVAAGLVQHSNDLTWQVSSRGVLGSPT